MYILFDIGATMTQVGITLDGEHVEESLAFPTPHRQAEMIPLWRQKIKPLLGDGHAEAVIGGVAGFLSKDKTVILHSVVLPDWNNVHLSDQISQIFDHTPVYLEHDAALAGLGEAVRGAGQEKKIVAYLHVDTVLEGVRIVDGYVDMSASGFAPGQQLLLTDDGNVKTLNSFLHQAGMSTLGEGDFESNRMVRKQVALYVAIGIHNAIVHWSPHIVVLGGILAGEHIDIGLIRSYVQKISKGFTPSLVSVEKAELGDRGVLYGALEFGRSKLHLTGANSLLFDF